MSRKTFVHVRRAATEPASEFPPLASYRCTVVELPWPDYLGRRVLLAIDWRGRICDQRTACDEADAQRVTDKMMADMENARQWDQSIKASSADVVPLYAPASTLGVS